MEDDELTASDRIVIALTTGQEPNKEDIKVVGAKGYAEIKADIEDAQSRGYSVELPF